MNAAPVGDARRLDIGMVLLAPNGDQLLVVDIIGVRCRLCRIPESLTAADYGVRFRHQGDADDPARPVLRE